MSSITVGIVDYGVGNHASVWRTLRTLGYRCRVTPNRSVLDQADVLLLPGVGAFAAAMEALEEHGLAEYLRDKARERRPIIGICLGMQLLAEASHEHRLTSGLGLVPGEVVSIGEPRWHIGWNTLEMTDDQPWLRSSDGRSFYFNHSFTVRVPPEYELGVARAGAAIPAIIGRGSVLGMQFHPEKSQASGRALLQSAITHLCNA